MSWPSLSDIEDFELDSWHAWPLASFDMFRAPLARWHRTPRFTDLWLDAVRCREAKRAADKGTEEPRSERLKRMRARYREMEAEGRRRAESERRRAEGVQVQLEGFRAANIDVRPAGAAHLKITAHRTDAAGLEVQQRLLPLPERLRGTELQARFDGRVLTVGRKVEKEEPPKVEMEEPLKVEMEEPPKVEMEEHLKVEMEETGETAHREAKEANAPMQNAEETKVPIEDVEDIKGPINNLGEYEVPISVTGQSGIPVRGSKPPASRSSESKGERRDADGARKQRAEDLEDATVHDES